MMYHAETTSVAMRFNNSWVLCMPALALTRVRLEQTIVCSYLIHEDINRGLGPFFLHTPISQYKNLQIASEHKDIGDFLSKAVGIESAKQKAVEAQERFTPGFTIENDKFTRKWTALDLCSMAKKRDDLVTAKKPKWSVELAPAYDTIYRTASSVVHADASCLSPGFMDVFKPNGDKAPTLVSGWPLIVAASGAHFDLVQCYEVLNYFGLPDSNELIDVINEYTDTKEKFMPNPS